MIFLKKDELLGRHCFNVLKVFDFLQDYLKAVQKKKRLVKRIKFGWRFIKVHLRPLRVLSTKYDMFSEPPPWPPRRARRRKNDNKLVFLI